VELASVLTALAETNPEEELAAHWGESVASMPEGAPSFLDPAEFLVSRDWGSLDAEADAHLMEAAGRILADPHLKALAWHGYRRLYDWPECGGFGRWPALENSLGELAGCFNLLIGLGMVPKVRARHEAMGVSETVTRDTCKQLWSFSDNYRRGNGGRLGLPGGQLHWLSHYVAGKLFRLGRFEYKLEAFNRPVRVFRHGPTGNVVALSENGVRFDGEGHAVNPEAEPRAGEWTASLAVGKSEVAGTPISPEGVAVRRAVRLPITEWECVLKPGDFTLDMHIPAGGGMTPARCIDSMRRAVPFFQEHFPNTPFRSITCASWIFGPQLEEILPPTANLVQYMRELYLFPVPTYGDGGLWFIFFRHDCDPQSVPRDTSIQRAVADYLAAGKTWRVGGMFTLVDDLAHYGSACYRTKWPETERLMPA
jgi:GNAT-like C-terminal domain/N-acyltransferase N-terminal domain